MPNVVDLVVASVAVVAALVWPLAEGVAAGRVVPVVAVSLVAGLAVGVLPRTWSAVGFLVGVVVAVVVSQLWDLDSSLWAGLILGFIGGCVGGGYRAARRRPGRRRSASASGSPSGSAPSSGGSLADLARPELELVHDDGDGQRSVEDPSAAAVLRAITALDGRERTVVSLVRGRSRLDLAGEASGAMMAYHCDDHTDHRATWYHLTTPDSGDDQVEVTVAGVVGHFAARQTCRSDAAVRAARYYLDTGGRDPQLAWIGGREVAEMRPDTMPSTTANG